MMAEHKPTSSPHLLLGRRFVTDFRVIGVTQSDGGELEAILLMHGDEYRISVEELETVIERGLVAEVPLLGGGP
jgi:hypothetical protein